MSATEFTDLMRPFLPFEARPVLAVAVSGGRDSRALALLAQQWARRRRGRVVALVVDHGLRPEAAAEAERTCAWLATFAIDARVLRWRPPVPLRTGVQAAARAARYRLLLQWCQDNGVLHLLTAHQADDQVETCALRAARDSGPIGLAGMSAIVEYPQARLLRPLLPVPRSRLTATLEAGGHDWIDDPSNADPRFARARLRRETPGLRRDAALRRAARYAGQRIRVEGAMAAALAACATTHPLGAVLIDHAAWRALPAAAARQAIAAAVATVAGDDYLPRLERVARATAQMRALPRHAPPPGLTLGGCRILWRGGGWLIVREPASIATGDGSAVTRWDGRFDVGGQAPGQENAAVRPMAGWCGDLRQQWVAAWPATPGLPAIFAGLPALKVDGGAMPCGPPGMAAARFRPLKPLASGPFFACFA